MLNERVFVADAPIKEFSENLKKELLAPHAKIKEEANGFTSVYAAWTDVYVIANDTLEDFQFSRGPVEQDQFGNAYVITTVKANGNERTQPYPLDTRNPTAQNIQTAYARAFVKSTAELTGIGFELWSKPEEIKQRLLNRQANQAEEQAVEQENTMVEEVKHVKQAIMTVAKQFLVQSGFFDDENSVDKRTAFDFVSKIKEEVSQKRNFANELELYQTVGKSIREKLRKIQIVEETETIKPTPAFIADDMDQSNQTDNVDGLDDLDALNELDSMAVSADEKLNNILSVDFIQLEKDGSTKAV
ncbi:hypothetical protein JOC36_001460 [Weissella uvarum]|uniref:hypothetical protein n=1 Tax=Weissella uvarum TaxID=1479233 RepID=UPI00195F4CAD|nr:hypothetical protein [Weissella uvarum]MBM7617867.1 hypothetical protein [Weissella uvarum]MCM0596135.1 hypothetical protein [Weissella uvarum]